MNIYELDIFRLASQGYCCSQIVLMLGMELQENINTGLVRAVSGLCHGFPKNTGACGALTGAACLLGLYAGKGEAEEEEDERLILMLDELAEWFNVYCSDRSSGIVCDEIVSNGKPESEICGRLIAECYGQAMTILTNNGFSPDYSNG